MCSCGFPQSFPIPHEHDRTDREIQIITHYKQKVHLAQQEFNQVECRNCMDFFYTLDTKVLQVLVFFLLSFSV